MSSGQGQSKRIKHRQALRKNRNSFLQLAFANALLCIITCYDGL